MRFGRVTYAFFLGALAVVFSMCIFATYAPAFEKDLAQR